MLLPIGHEVCDDDRQKLADYMLVYIVIPTAIYGYHLRKLQQYAYIILKAWIRLEYSDHQLQCFWYYLHINVFLYFVQRLAIGEVHHSALQDGVLGPFS